MNLATFFVNLLVDDSKLKPALDRSKAQLEAAKAGNFAGLPPAMQEKLKKHEEDTKKAKEAAEKFNERLDAMRNSMLGIAGIDLGAVLNVATWAGAIAMLGTLTSKFRAMQDEVFNAQAKMKMLGIEVKSGTERLWAFGRAAQEQFGIAASEARKMALHAATHSLDPNNFERSTAAAMGMAQAFGINAQRAQMVVQQLEAGNFQMVGRFHPALRQMIQYGAGRMQIEAKINEFIAQGATLAKERQNTFQAQFDRLKFATNDLVGALAMAFGGILSPVVSALADTVTKVAVALRGWVDTHRQLISSQGQVIAGALSLAAAWRYGGLALSYLGGLFSWAGSAVMLLAGPLVSLLAIPFQAMLSPLLLGLTALRAGFAAAAGGVVKLSMALTVNLGASVASAAAGLMTLANPLTYLRGLMSVVGLAFGGAGVGVRIFSAALRGLLIATGIGLIVGLVGAIAGIGDTFGEQGSILAGFAAFFKDVWAGLMAYLAPVWQWIRVEGAIVFKALVAYARQMIDNLVELFDFLWQYIGPVVNGILDAFMGLFQWLGGLFGASVTSWADLWTEFTAELAVLGLRMKQIFLNVMLAIASIPAVVEWLGSVFAALGTWFGNNWKNIMLESLNTVMSAITLLGTVVSDLSNGIKNMFSGKIDFDFSATQAAFEGLKNQASKVLEGIEIPGLDLSRVAPELQGQLAAVTGQIDEAKRAARVAQTIDRTKYQDQKGTSAGINAGVKIGGRDKAHFTAPDAFWKKLQEAAASQRVEQVAVQQLNTQQEMVRILTAINEAQMRPAPADGGVVPR